MSTIDALATTVRQHLNEIEEEAGRGYLKAPEVEGWTGWDKSTVAGLPPAVIALVLREVAARRKLIELMLAEKHGAADSGVRYRPCEALADLAAPCDCGRDERVAAYLRVLAEPYQETT